MNTIFDTLVLNFETFFILLITLIYFCIASFEDFKKKEVYNYLNYSYVFIVIAFALVMSIINQDSIFLVQVVVGIILGFFLGTLIFNLGIWGGGDGKFLIGFGGCFAVLSSTSLHSFIIFSFQYASLKYVVASYLFPFVYGASVALLFCSCIGVFLLLYLLFKRRRQVKLFKDGLLLVSLLLFQIFALFPLLDFEIRVFCGTMFILGFFMIPEDAFLNLGTFKHKTLQELREDLKNGKVWHITQDVISKSNKVILKVEECLDGVTEHHIHLLERSPMQLNNVQVVRPFTIGFLMFANMFVMLLSFTYSSFFMVFDIFVHMIEFLLLSFTIGGIYVIFLLLFHCFKSPSFVYNQISHTKQNIFVCCVILAIGIKIMFPSSILTSLLSLSCLLYIIFEIAKIVEKRVFIAHISPSKLTCGDWIIEDVVLNDLIIYKKEDFILGVSQEQIDVIKKYEKKISQVTVKTGIAFIPHLFLGFLVLLLIKMI